MTVINGLTNSTTGITVGLAPVAVAVNQNTNRIYVANLLSQSVSVIDGTTDTVVATVATANRPVAVAVNTVTNKIYVDENDDGSVIDGASNSTTGVFLIGSPNGIAVNQQLNKTYVTTLSSFLTVIDGDSLPNAPVSTPKKSWSKQKK